MTLSEDQMRLLELYHDYLRQEGLCVCERVARPDGSLAHRPVLGRRGKELTLGFARSSQATGVGRRAPEEQEQQQDTDDLGHRLHQTMDAKEWALAFMRIVVDGNVPIDEGLMIGWFANAIMTGWDFSAARSRKQEQEEQERG